MPPPRNHATLVYNMSGVTDWLWWRINEIHSFEQWKRECLRSKNRAIIQTHDGVTLWARLEDFNARHQSEYYSEVSDANNFYLIFRQTCDFWDRGQDSNRNISNHMRPIAYAQVSYMGVVWQVGRSNQYLEY
ncbi:hypothetical protein FHL15_004496 [Xylaria flabelliformis]|uniref:Uncharacterized protein n=1 Tax=Xylaria flabelliformis TaxID=2512241 RepID=A0A553I3E4_9PEZI|nr:hypothetical protein FHL15_004496 [Xylaria flabelliformis]